MSYFDHGRSSGSALFKGGKFAKGLSSSLLSGDYSNMAIDGGAATMLEMYLDKNKTLQSYRFMPLPMMYNRLEAATLVR